MSKKITIFLAEDDNDDVFLFREALAKLKLDVQLIVAKDGESFTNAVRNSTLQPDFVFLDLNMPKKDGREALKEIKANSGLRSIPVVVLTTSKAEEDVYRTYDLGVSSFISKPVTFDSLVGIVRELGRYWFEIVELPKTER